MEAPMTNFQRLRPYLKGAIGALLILCLYLCYSWLSLRWIEFQIMRADIAFIHPSLEAQRAKIAAQQAEPPKATPTPTTEGSKK